MQVIEIRSLKSFRTALRFVPLEPWPVARTGTSSESKQLRHRSAAFDDFEGAAEGAEVLFAGVDAQ